MHVYFYNVNFFLAVARKNEYTFNRGFMRRSISSRPYLHQYEVQSQQQQGTCTCMYNHEHICVLHINVFSHCSYSN